MAQKTAVDYLFEQLWETPKDKLEWYAILSKAKQMEKEQICDALDFGKVCLLQSNYKKAEHYYNETYGK